jgi:iron complex outermembrane receptor protein
MRRPVWLRAAMPVIVALAWIVTESRAQVPAAPAVAASAAAPAQHVTITGARASGFSLPPASAVGKSDVPLRETPVSIQVVPEGVLADQRVTRLQEALENVSGVRSNNTDLEGYVYKLRGFSSLNLYRNALAVTFSIPTIQEAANLERVEVLKGPASILFGRVDPGGVINLVTQRPQTAAAYRVEQEFGSYGHARTVWDATGALGDAGTAAYRFSGAFQEQDSHRDFGGGRRSFVAPALSFKLGANTDLLVDAQYMRNETETDTGIPGLLGTGRPADVPLSRSFLEPNDPRDFTESHAIGYELEHRFNADWRLTNRFLYSQAWLWKANVVGFALDEASGDLDRAVQHQWLDGSVYSTNLDLQGRFDAWGASHRVLIGIDHLRDRYDYHYAQDGGGYVINLLAPVYGGVSDADYRKVVNGNVGPDGFATYSSLLVRQTGLYVQDHITWNGWHLLAGARYDDARKDLGRGGSRADSAAERKASPGFTDKEWSPRLGVLYDLTPGLSVYASHSRSFGANNGDDGNGQPLPPEAARQHELGLKALFGKELSATLALYELTKTNISQQVSPTISRAIGEARSRGLEVDVVGNLTSQTSLIASYAYTDAVVTQDNGGLQGKRLDNAPRHTARLFASHRLGDGALGWRVGGGFYAASRAAANRDNEVWLPGHARADAFASYTRRIGEARWTAQLNVRNLFDRDHFEGSDEFYNFIDNPRFHLLPGQPRALTATLKVEL